MESIVREQLCEKQTLLTPHRRQFTVLREDERDFVQPRCADAGSGAFYFFFLSYNLPLILSLVFTKFLTYSLDLLDFFCFLIYHATLSL